MRSIVELIDEYIHETGQAKRDMRNGRAGVVFLDEGQFIPLTDIGYNHELGFYRLSLFPDAENEAKGYNENPG